VKLEKEVIQLSRGKIEIFNELTSMKSYCGLERIEVEVLLKKKGEFVIDRGLRMIFESDGTLKPIEL
jgi:hypothetical protein